MRRSSIDLHQVGPQALAQAAAILAAGGVVAFPTETAYGLAADPRNRAAVEKIYAIKAREKGKPLPLIAASREAADAAVELSPALRELADRFWPGPLTLVAPPRAEGPLAPPHLQRDGTVAIRVSPALWPGALAAAAGGVITATSANISGKLTLYDGEEVAREFAGRDVAPDLLLDAGRLPEVPPSTIVAEKDGGLAVLRQGTITI